MRQRRENPPDKRYCVGPCKRLLDLTEENFDRDTSKKHGLSYRCKDCRRLRPRNIKREQELHRRTYYPKTYGITNEEVDRMIEKQKGCCAICHEAFDFSNWRYVHVDHDHQTGAIRDILCHKCNNGLGCFRDSVLYLESAIKYLRKHG